MSKKVRDAGRKKCTSAASSYGETGLAAGFLCAIN